MAQKASSLLFHDLQLPSGRRVQIPTGLFIDNAFHLAAEPSGTFESVVKCSTVLAISHLLPKDNQSSHRGPDLFRAARYEDL